MDELNQLPGANTLDKLYFISDKMTQAGDKVATEVSELKSDFRQMLQLSGYDID